MKTKKLINFKNDSLMIAIQTYADENCEGNFSMAVRQLLSAGINKLTK